MPPIVTLTMNPTIDENSSVEYVFSDVKLRCRAPSLEPGGGGINVARAVARLGGEALAVYAAGGPSGDLLKQLLDREGVPQLPIPIGEWTRRNLNVREDATGRQYRFVFPGPSLTESEWRSCLDTLEAVRPGPAFLVASGSLPPASPKISTPAWPELPETSRRGSCSTRRESRSGSPSSRESSSSSRACMSSSN